VRVPGDLGDLGDVGDLGDLGDLDLRFKCLALVFIKKTLCYT
jgi:hypothetical protein